MMTKRRKGNSATVKKSNGKIGTAEGKSKSRSTGRQGRSRSPRRSRGASPIRSAITNWRSRSPTKHNDTSKNNDTSKSSVGRDPPPSSKTSTQRQNWRQRSPSPIRAVMRKWNQSRSSPTKSKKDNNKREGKSDGRNKSRKSAPSRRKNRSPSPTGDVFSRKDEISESSNSNDVQGKNRSRGENRRTNKAKESSKTNHHVDAAIPHMAALDASLHEELGSKPIPSYGKGSQSTPSFIEPLSSGRNNGAHTPLSNNTRSAKGNYSKSRHFTYGDGRGAYQLRSPSTVDTPSQSNTYNSRYSSRYKDPCFLASLEDFSYVYSDMCVCLDSR